MKTCSVCKQLLSDESFYRHKTGALAGKLGYRCKRCDYKNSKRYIATHRKTVNQNSREAKHRQPAWKRKEASLKYRYGITFAAFTALMERQGSVCAICQKPGRKLVVDHDHLTGTVRGLLCDSCNVSIGRLGDTHNKLLRVIEYFRQAHEQAQKVDEAATNGQAPCVTSTPLC